MIPNLFDHALAALILLALPVYGYLSFPKVKKRLAEDKPGVRVRLYRRTMTWQWTLTAIVVGAWLAAGRSLPELGFRLTWSWGTAVAALLAAAIIALMTKQLLSLPGHPEVHEAVRDQLEGSAPFLPRNPNEHGWFTGVAITAGVCEEVLFRGFCLAYVACFAGPWGSVLVTSLIFGLGHLYQGRGGAFKTGIVGLVTGAMVVGGGTIWLPILLHVFVDIHGGLVYRVVKR